MGFSKEVKEELDVEDLRFQKKENNRVVKTEEKSQILREIQNHSKKEAEKVIFKHFPNQEIKPERERRLTEQVVEIRFNADAELLTKLKRIKDLTGHKNINPSYNELFHELADFMLKKIDPLVSQHEVKQKKMVENPQQEDNKTEELHNTEQSQLKHANPEQREQNDWCQKVLSPVKVREPQPV
ncbi:MAG: hypothetical protein HY072_04690 [Deltaproteobacteria bacterium]|nr:hypothetical protein [Deltaproteobacteria bacterium]